MMFGNPNPNLSEGSPKQKTVYGGEAQRDQESL